MNEQMNQFTKRIILQRYKAVHAINCENKKANVILSKKAKTDKK